MQLDRTTVLAFGTAGAQGTGLVTALQARGADPVRVSSDPDRAAAWRADGHRTVVADLTDTASLVRAAQTTTAGAAVLHVPLGLMSAAGATAAVQAVTTLREAGLAVAVNLGGAVPPDGAPDPTGRAGLAAALTATGANVLTPTAYLENHLAPWAVGPLAAGELLYPRPAEDVIGWIAAQDVTAAAVAALASEKSGELFRLGGPEPLTFTELADALGRGTGRALRFREVAAADYGAMLEPYVGPQAAAGVAGMYGAMPRTPDPSLAPDVGEVWSGLGVTPTTAQDWAAGTLSEVLAGS